MEVLLAVMLLSGFLTKVVQDGRTDRAYASRGMVSPRHQARLARLRNAGRPASPAGRGPLRNYLSELYADAILDLQERHRAKRDARPPYDPNRPSLAARFDRAVLDAVERLKQSRGWEAVKATGRAVVAPVPEKSDPPSPNRTPDGDLYFGDDPTDPNAVKQCQGCRGDGVVDGAPCEECRARQEIRNDDHENTGEPMTAAVNTEAATYETASAALAELVEATRNLSEHVGGAVAAADVFHAHVEEIDQAKREVEAAVASVMDQMDAKGVDAATMARVSAAMELINANDLTTALDGIESAKASLSGAQAGAAEASTAVGDAQASLTATYGEMDATLREHGTDPTFVGV